MLLGVLAGLFAMHGLSAHHDMAMVGAHGPDSAAVAEPMSGHQSAASDTSLAQRGAAVTPVSTEAPAPDPMSDMAQACVAILTGAAALALLLLSPLRPLLARWLTLGQPVLRSRSRRLSPPRPPDLSVLCVLRT